MAHSFHAAVDQCVEIRTPILHEAALQQHEVVEVVCRRLASPLQVARVVVQVQRARVVEGAA